MNCLIEQETSTCLNVAIAHDVTLPIFLDGLTAAARARQAVEGRGSPSAQG